MRISTSLSLFIFLSVIFKHHHWDYRKIEVLIGNIAYFKGITIVIIFKRFLNLCPMLFCISGYTSFIYANNVFVSFRFEVVTPNKTKFFKFMVVFSLMKPTERWKNLQTYKLEMKCDSYYWFQNYWKWRKLAQLGDKILWPLPWVVPLLQWNM